MHTDLMTGVIVEQPDNIKQNIKDFLSRLIKGDRFTREKLTHQEVIADYGKSHPSEAKILKSAFYKAFLIPEETNETPPITSDRDFAFWTKFTLFKLDAETDKSALKFFKPFAGSQITHDIFDRAVEVFLYHLTSSKVRFDYKSFLRNDVVGKQINDYLRENLIGYRHNDTLLSFLQKTLFTQEASVEENNFALLEFLMEVIKIASAPPVRLKMPLAIEDIHLPEKDRNPLPYFDVRSDIVRRMYDELYLRNATLDGLVGSLTTIKGPQSFLFRKEERRECYWLKEQFDHVLKGESICSIVRRENNEEIAMDFTDRFIEMTFIHSMWLQLIK